MGREISNKQTENTEANKFANKTKFEQHTNKRVFIIYSTTDDLLVSSKYAPLRNSMSS